MLEAPADGSVIGSFVIGVPVVGPYIDIGIEEDSFTPVGIFLTYPFVLAASGDAEYSNMAELAEYAQDNDVVMGHFGAVWRQPKHLLQLRRLWALNSLTMQRLTCWIVTPCHQATQT